MEMNAEQKVEGGVKRQKCNMSNESITDENSKLENTLEDYIRACPEEIHMVILSCLPSITLSTYKRVCKHWNTTLTIQAFMVKHSRSYDEHSKLAFVAHKTTRGHDAVLSFELSHNNIPKTTEISILIKNSETMEISTEEVIIGNREPFTDTLLSKCKYNEMSNICNDLVCLFDYFSKLVGLLNLKTGDFINLPAVTTQKVGRIRFWYALGFDPEHKVYKLLCIYGEIEEFCTKAAIFTLGSSKDWKPIEYEYLRSAVTTNWRFWINQNRFCLDGVIYWLNDNEISGASVLTVVGFDLNREVFIDYILDTRPIEDDETIKYYLTSLKGRPTLFVWSEESDEIQQLTLFNHNNNSKAAWNRRSFTIYECDFPVNFPYGCLQTCVAGGSILLQRVRPFTSSLDFIKKPEEEEEDDDSPLSCYIWYDLENFAIDD